MLRKYMLILGHRGFIGPSPYQNSRQAFTIAVTDGDGFETDACLSQDGDVFLIHEAKYADAAKGVEYSLAEHLDTASAARLGSRRIDQLPAAEVRMLRLKDGQPIPTLREALELVGAHSGTLLNIELKAHNVAEPVARLVQSAIERKSIAPEALLMSSFNHYALPLIRRALPTIKTGAIFIGADQPTKPLFPWHSDDQSAYTSLTPTALQNPVLRETKPDCFVIPEEILTADTLAMIASAFPDAKIAAWVFTEKGNFDLPRFLTRLKTLPPDKIMAMIVDNPQAFKQAWAKG